MNVITGSQFHSRKPVDVSLRFASSVNSNLSATNSRIIGRLTSDEPKCIGDSAIRLQHNNYGAVGVRRPPTTQFLGVLRSNQLSEWLEHQIEKIRSLTGATISEWKCVEMSLGGGEDESEFIWRHPSVPMLQLAIAYFRIGDTWFKFLTYQNDYEYGVYSTKVEDPARIETTWSSGYRFLDQPILPTGRITDVCCRQNDLEDIECVHLQFANRSLTLWAGEVYENLDGTFDIAYMDDGLLVEIDARFIDAPLVAGGVPGSEPLVYENLDGTFDIAYLDESLPVDIDGRFKGAPLVAADVPESEPLRIEFTTIANGFIRVIVSGKTGSCSGGNIHGKQFRDEIRRLNEREHPVGILIDCRNLEYRAGNFMGGAVLGKDFPLDRMCLLSQR